MSDQQTSAMADLMIIQSVLGQLGFTLTSDGKYYKDYALSDNTAMRIIPVFDHGMSVDIQRRLTGFNLVTNKLIPVVQGISVNIDDYPVECVDDITKIISILAPLSRSAMSENFMMTQTCSMCANDVSSYIYMGGKYMCLRCAGLSDE